MSYTIQIAGPRLLTSDEVHIELHNATRNREVISDACAKTIASYWHSPGSSGSVLSRLSHGMEFDTDELIRDIDRTRPEAMTPEQHMELRELRDWAEHWAGDYRG
jgi:hypothetical protein